MIFDFNALTDHPQIISQELRDAGLVWEGVSRDELVRLTAQSIMDRISELHQINTSTLSSVGSASSTGLDLLTGDSPADPAQAPRLVLTETVMADGGSMSPRLSPPTEPSAVLPMHTAKAAVLPGRPPLHPPSQSPPSRSSMDSLDSAPRRISSFQALDSLGDRQLSVENHYLILSRESCAHLTTPLAPSLPSGDYPQPINRFETLVEGMGGVGAGVGGPGGAPAPGIGTRQGSISHSIDEFVMHQTYSLANWPSASPPLNTGRLATGEDVRQLQGMLAVTMGEKRHTSFVPGVYCAFTEDTVRDFQLHNGLEVTGDVEDRTWELLSEQASYRKKKEEDRALKREEAQKKAKIEQERKLQQQREESARAMDNMMEKTLSGIANTKGPLLLSPGMTAASSPLPPTSPVAALLQPTQSAPSADFSRPPTQPQ